MKNSVRIHSLDHIRGLAAFGIMIYHFILFLKQQNQIEYSLDAAHLLERIAIYGVSIFYILSGLTLYLVYRNHDLSQIHQLKSFFIKRFFRIFPLFIALTLFVFLVINRNFSENSIKTLILNITGLFSIFKWNAYILTGGWSIGNELVFYLIFPIALLLIQRNTFLFRLLMLSSLGLYIWFAYAIIHAENDLSQNWFYYINPLNQIFLFLAGINIGYIFAQHSTAGSIVYYL